MKPKSVQADDPSLFAPVPIPETALQPTATLSQSWKAPVSGNWLTASNWAPGGVPTASTAATIAAAGIYKVTIGNGSVAQSLTIDATGATVADGGSLLLDGTLNIEAGRFILDYGTLTGAIIDTGAHGTFLDEGGTLSSSTVQGTLTLEGNAFANLNNVAFAGAGGTGLARINVTGSGSELVYTTSATLDNAVVHLGADIPGDSGFTGATIVEETTGATLTLGSDLAIDQFGLQAALFSSGALVNNGTINANSAGGSFTLGAQGALINRCSHQ